MSRAGILVNGVPASGKSTVARRLAADLALPLLALDTVKEALFAELGTGDRAHNRALGRGSYAAIWALVGEFPADGAVVVDAWFGFQPPDVLRKHLAAAGVTRLVEVWCHAPAAVVAARYAARAASRHPGHLGLDYLPELQALAESARPLGVAPVVFVDTSLPPQWDRLKARIAAILPLSRSAPLDR